MASRNFRLVTVEPALFLYMFGTFLVVPILQQLAFKKICHQEYGASICDSKNFSSYKQVNDDVQKRTASFMLYQSIALTIPSVLACLWFGAISDKVGRKYILVLPPIGSLLQGLGYVINTVYFNWDVNYLMVGIFLSGFTGGFSTIFVAAFSYMADITDKSNRTKRMGILESMTFMGGTLGELIGGVMVEKLGYNSVFLLYLALAATQILYTLFLVQESYFPEESASLFRTAFSVSRIKELAQVYLKPRNPKRNRTFLVLLQCMFFIFVTIITASGTVLILMLKTPKLDFSPSYIGYLLATIFGVRSLGLFVGIPVMVKLQFNEYIIALIGTTSLALSLILQGVSTKIWMLFACGCIGVLGATEFPIIRALMSMKVAANEQGTLFAAIAAVESCTSFTAAIIATPLYSATVSWFPGFTLVVLGTIAIVFGGFTLVFLFTWDRRCQDRYRVMIEDNWCPPADGSSSPDSVGEEHSPINKGHQDDVHMLTMEESS